MQLDRLFLSTIEAELAATMASCRGDRTTAAMMQRAVDERRAQLELERRRLAGQINKGQ